MFTIVDKVGSGSFGDVYKAIRKEDGKVVALKVLPKYGCYRSREIDILTTLGGHSNIISILGHYLFKVRKETDNTTNQPQVAQMIVMKFYPQTLKEYIQSKGSCLSLEETKSLTLQLCCAVLFVHENGVIHRDIKSTNILVENGNLVLADFGCAKYHDISTLNIVYTGSRYYRAPELLLNSKSYNEKIDIWSVGCVIIECLTGQPPFRGRDTASQIVNIFRGIGTPSVTDLLTMNDALVRQTASFPQITPNPLFAQFGEETRSLLSKIFVYDPRNRISARELTKHPFFCTTKNE